MDYASRALAGIAADLFAEWFRSPMDWASTLVDTPASSSIWCKPAWWSMVAIIADTVGTATSPKNFGDFIPGGFALLVEDMARLTDIAKEERPEVPFVLLGHSMGSFAAQQFVINNSDLIDGLALSGSGALDGLVRLAQTG